MINITYDTKKRLQAYTSKYINININIKFIQAGVITFNLVAPNDVIHTENVMHKRITEKNKCQSKSAFH